MRPLKRTLPASFLAGVLSMAVPASASNQPASAAFHDPQTGASCSATGKPGSPDPDLNQLKNRILMPSATSTKSVAYLRTLPKHAKSPRSSWTQTQRNTFLRYEGSPDGTKPGMPISIVGYLIGQRQEAAESTNCEAADNDGVDIHTWIVDQQSQTKTSAAVAEDTPRWRAVNPSWSVTNLQALVEQGAQVRISGLMTYDQEHPEQVGKTRVTLWEIHPITKIEVNTNLGWVEIGQSKALAAVGNSAQNRLRSNPNTRSRMPVTMQIIASMKAHPGLSAQQANVTLTNTRSSAMTAKILQEESTLP